jgi:hypothetical protein
MKFRVDIPEAVLSPDHDRRHASKKCAAEQGIA